MLQNGLRVQHRLLLDVLSWQSVLHLGRLQLPSLRDHGEPRIPGLHRWSNRARLPQLRPCNPTELLRKRADPAARVAEVYDSVNKAYTN